MNLSKACVKHLSGELKLVSSLSRYLNFFKSKSDTFNIYCSGESDKQTT